MDLVKVADTFVSRERTNYQIRHFVIGQHDTPQQQYRQLVVEAQALIYKIKSAEIQRERSLLELEKLASSTEPEDKLKVEEIRLGLWYGSFPLEAAKQELEYLLKLSKQYRHYTMDDVEANEPEYWAKRLSRQAEFDRLGAQTGISAGNLNSIRQANIEQEVFEHIESKALEQ